MLLISVQVLKSFIQVKRPTKCGIASMASSVGIGWRDVPGTNLRPRSGESRAWFLLEPYWALLFCHKCGNAYTDCSQSLHGAFRRLDLWNFVGPFIMSFVPQSDLCNRESIFRKSPVSLFGLGFQKHLSELHFFGDLQLSLKILPFEIWISDNIQADMKDKVLVRVTAASRCAQDSFPLSELPPHSLKPGQVLIAWVSVLPSLVESRIAWLELFCVLFWLFAVLK